MDHTAALRRLFEVACRHRLLAKALNRGHHVVLLGEEKIAKLLGPLQLVAHYLQHAWERHQRLDAGIPALGLQGGGQSVVLQCTVAVDADPARGLDHFERIGRSHQDLGNQRVRIERDRRHQLRELGVRQERPRLGYAR